MIVLNLTCRGLAPAALHTMSSVMPFCPSRVPLLRSHLSMCIQLLEQVRPLLDAFVVDFFTENHWDTLLPEGWKTALEDMTEEELATWMQPESEEEDKEMKLKLRRPLPLAMLALR